MFSSRNCLVLTLIFRPIIHFELIFFIKWVGVQFSWGYQAWCPRTIRWKDYSFSHWIVMALFSKLIDHKYKGLFLDSLSYPIELSVYPYITKFWFLQLSSKFWNVSLPTSFFFFKIVFAILGPLNFCLNFSIIPLISEKKPAVILVGLHWIYKSCWGVFCHLWQHEWTSRALY